MHLIYTLSKVHVCYIFIHRAFGVRYWSWKGITNQNQQSDTKPLPGNIRYLSYIRLTRPLCVTKNTFSC
ncbi:hypothetical protein [Staphylococcus phage vB_SauM-V1SA15]|nr:hypothetical protein [Staphylococcus phage vB_SauM-V1SA15]